MRDLCFRTILFNRSSIITMWRRKKTYNINDKSIIFQWRVYGEDVRGATFLAVMTVASARCWMDSLDCHLPHLRYPCHRVMLWHWRPQIPLTIYFTNFDDTVSGFWDLTSAFPDCGATGAEWRRLSAIVLVFACALVFDGSRASLLFTFMWYVNRGVWQSKRTVSVRGREKIMHLSIAKT